MFCLVTGTKRLSIRTVWSCTFTFIFCIVVSTVVFVVTQRKVQPTRMLQWRMGVRKALWRFVLWPALQSWRGSQSSSSEYMCTKSKRSRCESTRSVLGTTPLPLNLSTVGKKCWIYSDTRNTTKSRQSKTFHGNSTPQRYPWMSHVAHLDFNLWTHSAFCRIYWTVSEEYCRTAHCPAGGPMSSSYACATERAWTARANHLCQ